MKLAVTTAKSSMNRKSFVRKYTWIENKIFAEIIKTDSSPLLSIAFPKNVSR